MLKHFLEAALSAEMDLHLDSEQRQKGNRRNGKVSKQVRTSDGVIEVETSRDRSSGFEPQIIRKRETVLAENLEPRIVSMYGLGMSFRDISSHLKEMYDMDISHDKWGKKYPKVIESWQRNWEKLSTYFKYTEPIRHLIFTTNTIEGFHRQVRKVTKTKGAFPTDMALLKLIYLSHQNISKK